MNEKVREASIEWVSLAIQRERPSEKQPAELAEQLVQIAEDEAIGIEQLVAWIHMLPDHEELTTRRWAHFAVAASLTREMQQRQAAEDL